MRHLIAPCAAFLVPLLVSCADAPLEGTRSGPRITGLSKQEVVVGETLEFYGEGFLDGDAGVTRLRFEGEFVADDGTREPVQSFVVTPLVDGVIEMEGEGEGEVKKVLRWSRFGPFDNPFHSADRPGVFRGFVIAENVSPDGEVTSDTEPRRFTLKVEPSLVIEQFQPIDARCTAPALRALAGIPYRMVVRAVGITPIRFEYELANVNGMDGAVRFTHEYGPDQPQDEDVLGEDEAVIFNLVPDEEQFYVTGIRVVATDAKGRTVETAMPVSVHRPIEVVYDGGRELAERYEPVPVSGCIPGGARTRVSYIETRSETRQQSVSVTVSRTFVRTQGSTATERWREGISAGETRSRTLGGTETELETAEETYGVRYGTSEANEVDFSSTDGESWSWDMSEEYTEEEYRSRMNALYGEGHWSGTVGVEGSGSIPGFAKVTGSASTTVGVRAGGEVAGTTGARRRETTGRGWSMSGRSSQTRSFGSTTTESQSRSLSGTYALTRSRSRTFADTETIENTRTWAVGGETADSRVISQGDEETVAQTLVSSETDETIQSFSGLLPRGKYGIFYRQTTRWVRRAEVRAYDLCGIARHVGELQFNEWTWAPDLAIAESCDVVPPPPNLPPAECFIEPCGG